MKKIICVFAAAALLLGVYACAVKPAAEPLTGTPEEILALLKEKVEPLMTQDSAVTAELAQGATGLTAAQFEEYVVTAAESAAVISAQAQTTVVLQCKDAAAASQVKTRIAAEFDSGKWICVFPEQSLVMEAGSYVMLAAGTKDSTDALAAAFGELAQGQASAPYIFYTFDPGEDFIDPELAGEAEIFTGPDDDGATDPAIPDDDGGIIAF